MRPLDALAYVDEARQVYGAGGKWEHFWPLLASQMLRDHGFREQGHTRLGASNLDQLVGHSEFTIDETELGTVLAQLGRLSLQHGEVFIVRQSMCELIEGIWQSMPEQTLLPSDLPADEGIVFFEKPLRLAENGGPIWGTTFCSATTRTFDKAVREMLQETADLMPLETSRGCWVVPFRDKRSPEMPQYLSATSDMSVAQARRGIQSAPNIMLADVRMFEYGRPPSTFRKTVFGGYTWQRDPLMGRLAAFFALCRQELPLIERFEPTDKEQKAIRRMDMRDRRVSVILLRRTSGQRNGETDVEWSHRWLVRGHWRKQWYPSLKEHRLIYINPHIKGPEDKPFVMHQKVNVLGR